MERLSMAQVIVISIGDRKRGPFTTRELVEVALVVIKTKEELSP